MIRPHCSLIHFSPESAETVFIDLLQETPKPLAIMEANLVSSSTPYYYSG